MLPRPKGFQRSAREYTSAGRGSAIARLRETGCASRDPVSAGGMVWCTGRSSSLVGKRLKLGALGSAGLLLPLERFAGAAGGRAPTGSGRVGCPRPFTVPFVAPPVLSPVRTDADDRFLPHDAQTGARSRSCRESRRRSSATTASRPGPTIVAQRGRPVVVSARSTRCPACIRRSATRRTRRFTCTARRRCRNTTATPVMSHSRASGRTTTTRTSRTRARCGTTTTGSASRRRTPTSGSRPSTPARRRRAGLGLPGGAYDVPLIIRDAMFAGRRLADLRRPQPLGDVRRRHPRQRQAMAGDAGRAAQVPLPHAQRVGLALFRLRLSTRASRSR